MSIVEPDPPRFRESVIDFVRARRTDRAGEYAMCAGGHVTLYASCFAAMTLHYVGALADIDNAQQRAWADYINSWQDENTGLFIGPEISPEELTSPRHDWDHVTMHLTAHALPALHVLDARPVHELRFAYGFLDPHSLSGWLNERDWQEAWLEGNNLLFVGQFLTYLQEFEGLAEATPALETYFNWLDGQQDPETGLWGTNGYCDPYQAVYGGYHPLLVYYYCDRPVRRAERIMNTVLSLQHSDGSFTGHGGGGACEDVDAVDILVNLYKKTGYRTRAVRRALLRALQSVLSQQLPDGGFVYRRGNSFSQMGIARTKVPADTADLFSTWFRVHTLALICQVLQDHPLAATDWQFNDICSMGWHRPGPLLRPQPDPWHDRLPEPWLWALERSRQFPKLGQRALQAACRSLRRCNWH